MRDPHIHAEKMIVPGFGNAEMRETVIAVTGLAPDMPKTVGTGCGRWRPFAMTSREPGKITCLACREWARNQLLYWAETAEALAGAARDDPEPLRKTGSSPAEIAGIARRYRADADAFASPGITEKGPADG